MVEVRSPRSQPRYLAVFLFPSFRLLFSSYKWILRSRHDRNIRSSDDFEHPQGVRHFLVEPLIARNHRDAQNFSLWRLDQEEHRLLVRSRGSGGVLINDDLASCLAPGSEAEGQ